MYCVVSGGLWPTVVVAHVDILRDCKMGLDLVPKLIENGVRSGTKTDPALAQLPPALVMA